MDDSDSKWKAMDDYSGIPTPVETANISSDFTDTEFVDNFFRYSTNNTLSDFEASLTNDLDEYYVAGNVINEELDFGGQTLTVAQIDNVNVNTLYSNCQTAQG